jgi:hypothetical protein
MRYHGRKRNRPKPSVVRKTFDELAAARVMSSAAYSPEGLTNLHDLENERFKLVHDGATRVISRAGEYALLKSAQRRAERNATELEEFAAWVGSEAINLSAANESNGRLVS